MLYQNKRYLEIILVYESRVFKKMALMTFVSWKGQVLRLRQKIRLVQNISICRQRIKCG